MKRRTNITMAILATLLVSTALMFNASNLVKLGRSSEAVQAGSVNPAYLPPWGQIVYINSNGSVTPAGAPIMSSDNITYTLTSDISYPTYDGIVVERNNTVINGNGFMVYGNDNATTKTGTGLNLTGTYSVTVEYATIECFQYGIYLNSSFDDNIKGNNVASNSEAIALYYSSNNTIISNNATNNDAVGIDLASSSSNNVVSGNDASQNGNAGIYVSSDDNVFSGNNASANSQYGIWVDHSNYNVVNGDNASANGLGGIWVTYTSNTTVSGNIVEANRGFYGSYGVYFYSSQYGIISRNTVTNSDIGIYIYFWSDNNIVTGNNIKANGFGLSMDNTGGNQVYHNNFINNTSQVYVYESGSVWDNGYPSGGNYWSGYNGTDLHSGPGQNLTGSDGIGDVPYVVAIDSYFNWTYRDNYPLMQPWSLAQPAVSVLCWPNPVTAGSIVNCTVTVPGSRLTGTVTWSTSSSTGNFNRTVCTLYSGSCWTTYVDSSPGSVTIAAYYSGDSNYQPSGGGTTLILVSNGSVYYSQNYNSVQAAINASTAGSTLIVAPGIYHEKLILDKKLTIIGDPDQAEFGGGGSGIFLTVYSGASGAIVTGFEINSYTDGILVYASYCKIYSNTMSSMVESGIVLDGSGATGDVVYDNGFENTPTAINLTDSAASNTIYGNIISSQATVTISVGTNDNNVYQNVISGSSIVLNVTNSQGNTFYHDDFLATTQIVATGTNTWDNGYSGNYWSDYLTKCPNAAEVDSSGIWNTSYPINSNNKDNFPLVKPYAPSVGHDTAVTLVVSTKTVIMQGYTGSVTVAVFNRGQYTETFTVTAYGNNTAMGTQQVTNLGSVGQATLTLTWNTTGCAIGKYTINAYADPVQGETDIANNNFTDGPIYVSMVGDLTGATPFVPDGKCDGRDITVVAKCFGSSLGDPRYNPNCDLLNRGKIDGRDITIVAKHFGQHDP